MLPTRTRWPAVLVGVLVGLAIDLGPAPGLAGNLRPFETPTERLIVAARQARLRSQFEEAAAILDHADAASRRPDARVLLERGLLARDRGTQEEAIDVLRRAADLDPTCDARVDLAGVLVGLGRWPQAVVVLEAAFEERGASLDIAEVTADPRFAPLARLEPYAALVERIREEQTGLVGRLRLRLEKIEGVARQLEDLMNRITRIVGALADLATAQWAAVVAMILLVFVIGLGIGQMRILNPPWTLLAGWCLGAGLWHAAARVVSGGDSTGVETILYAGGIILAPAAFGLLWRAWKSYRRRRAERRAEQRAKPRPRLDLGTRDDGDKAAQTTVG